MTYLSQETEYEIKSWLDSREAVKGLLSNATYIGTGTIVDVYYDVEHEKLFRKGVFVRVRAGKRLDIKFNPDLADLSHETCEELSCEFPLTDVARIRLSKFLRSVAGLQAKEVDERGGVLGLKEMVRIVKQRSEYDSPNAHIYIDEVEDLGSFIEVEAKSFRDALEVKRLCEAAGLRNMEIGYVELMLRQNNFPLYMTGRYVLSSDKEKRDNMLGGVKEQQRKSAARNAV